MEYISKEEYENILEKADNYVKHCKDILMPCAVCGKQSTSYVFSIIGSMKWYMCSEHKNASSFLNGNAIGVMYNGEFVNMPFLKEQGEIHKKLRKI